MAFSCKKRGFCPFCGARRMAETAALLAATYRTISGYLLSSAELTRATGHTGAMTLVQRFGSALNLNVHFHRLCLDGVYRAEGAGAPVFRPVSAPSAQLLFTLAATLVTLRRLPKLLEPQPSG